MGFSYIEQTKEGYEDEGGLGLVLKGPIVKGKEGGLRIGEKTQRDWADVDEAGQDQLWRAIGSGDEPGRDGGYRVNQIAGKSTLQPKEMGTQGVRDYPDARGVEAVGARRDALISQGFRAVEARSSMAGAGRDDQQRAKSGDVGQGRTRQLERIREPPEPEEEGHAYLSSGNRSRNPAQFSVVMILLQYLQNDQTTTIILSAPYTLGWVGIGFSKDAMMVGSSVMVGWINKHGHSKIKQFYLRAKKPSEVLEDKGELPLNNLPAAVATNGAEIHLAFQLKMEIPLERQQVLLAFSVKYPKNNNHLSKHDDKTSFVFDFTSGTELFLYKTLINFVLQSDSKGPLPSSNELIQMRKNHGIVGIIGWGLILPMGVIIARYFRHKDPQWFYLHAAIQFVGFTFGLVTIILGLQLYTKMNAHIPAHRGIGIFVFVLSILQILALFLRPNKDSNIRRIWNLYHNWFGRLAMLFATMNIVLGIQAAGAGKEWKIGYGFLFGITVVVAIVLEVLAYLRRQEMKSLPPNFQIDPFRGKSTFPTHL
ncbi:hypothetical protein Ahy_B02g057563 [Arachis hypogaea]|uniref:Cytochrome b561 domain-containing protein n=1 Tax=Arachis hypogaea TaxID=3818 RepID=A0A445ACJ4_ARAHY|nr:hypothetical protein Ahy_B02g057563 [Arachis hypogaea]